MARLYPKLFQPWSALLYSTVLYSTSMYWLDSTQNRTSNCDEDMSSFTGPISLCLLTVDLSIWPVKLLPEQTIPSRLAKSLVMAQCQPSVKRLMPMDCLPSRAGRELSIGTCEPCHRQINDTIYQLLHSISLFYVYEVDWPIIIIYQLFG